MQACIDEVVKQSELELIRLRLTLNAEGKLAATITALEPVQQPVKIAFYPLQIASTKPFLQYKTSARAVYNKALGEAKAAGLFDYLFCNEKGELTEGSRSNLFILLDNQWYTPPLNCGLLAGVQRSVLLDELRAQERVLYREDLVQAKEIIVCNALYGGLQAKMESYSSV